MTSSKFFPVWSMIAILPAALISPSGARLCPAGDLKAELAGCPYKIVYETFQDGNWELFRINADGSDPVNLTRTGDVDELYPHASPDGTKICFVADERKGEDKSRNVYFMNADGTGRTLVARNARQPFWNPGGTVIAYLKGELETYNSSSVASRGLFFFDLASGEHRAHANQELSHLFGVCWTPDGNWILATIHAAMGYRHAIVAIEVHGQRVVDLGIPGCRPEASPDGKQIAWTPTDWALRVADLDLTGPEPKVTGGRDIVVSEKPIKVYHIDWPPEGNYVAFARGPAGKRLGPAPEGVGTQAPGWNICVADLRAVNRWVEVTSDGNSNKEPDWIPQR